MLAKTVSFAAAAGLMALPLSTAQVSRPTIAPVAAAKILANGADARSAQLAASVKRICAKLDLVQGSQPESCNDVTGEPGPLALSSLCADLAAQDPPVSDPACQSTQFSSLQAASASGGGKSGLDLASIAALAGIVLATGQAEKAVAGNGQNSGGNSGGGGLDPVGGPGGGEDPVRSRGAS